MASSGTPTTASCTRSAATDVGFMDFTGLRSLFHLHDIATARGGRLRLLHPSDRIMRLLELTDTADQFEIVRRTTA
jgi:anti-anti-sigma factor